MMSGWPHGAVLAQTEIQPVGSSQVWRPSIILSDFGVDSNILTAAINQKRDTTAALTAQAEPAMRVGAVRLGGKISARANYFKHHEYERSIDTDDNVGIDVQSGRFKVFGQASYLRTRDRFDPQIYVRTQRSELTFEGGTEVRLGTRTDVGLRLHQEYSRFDAAQVFSMAGVRTDRDTTTQSVWVRRALTKLTSVVSTVDVQHESFRGLSPLAGTDLRLLAGAEFKPAALIAGKALVGRTRLGGTDTAPAGFTAQIDLAYTPIRSMRWSMQFERTLDRSMTIAEPYLTSTRTAGSVTQRLGPRWDVTAGASREALQYPVTAKPPAAADSPEGAAALVSLDKVFRYAAEANYRVGPKTRFAALVDYYQLNVHHTAVRYDRLRLVSSIVYRF